ncbi:hypothetical protein [Desulfatibacillum aliphaticivorans]|uniref:hypothetical protein n=1 Tax=Desulfatibacillum aliphaticivorans TaxID=218208 RepID=UPI000422C315|nr:hypothetical protein [Desulfatibacillum aliphaticivorans]
MKRHLLIIDPQNDFCDPNGNLYVPGAEEDMKRLADMIVRIKDEIDHIHVTLDSHKKVDISHPIWWKNAQGENPQPFTLISSEDVEAGRWAAANPDFQERSLEYLRALEAAGRYPHTIWPEHCLIGDGGHNITPVLAEAIHEWEAQGVNASFVTKGDNPWTEHFSAVKAEVPDPNDPSTQVNQDLIKTLEEADEILLAGEAATHCVMNTVADIADYFSDPKYIRKMVWIIDASSPVPDPPGTTLFSDKLARVFEDLVKKGMKTALAKDFMMRSA